jgi:uncharacterized protein YndB with AHSA1/START domain
MSVVSVDKDLERLALTLVAEFDAPVEAVWDLWADPRKLERWWGPPTHPATMERHDLRPGGRVTYFMTAPDGERFHGLWEILTVDPPSALEFDDLFADADGNVSPDLPRTTARLRLTAHEGGTRMELRSRFRTREQMDQVLAMGAAEGLQQAIGQMDGLLVAA